MSKMELDSPETASLKELTSQLTNIHREMTKLESQSLSNATFLQSSNRQSARNLVHYMALRRHDIRRLQEHLTSLGLSSLGRSEAHIKLAIEILLDLLRRLDENSSASAVELEERMQPPEWKSLLEQHTVQLLGPKPSNRNVRIMVTMPAEAADDYTLVRDLVSEGMDCMRINCAHDGEREWKRMVSNLQKARKETGKACKILMDLPGPKLRTGPLKPGPSVVKWRPRRDPLGRIVAPARIWLTPSVKPSPPPSHADACLPISPELISVLQPEDEVAFFDARDASRRLTIVDVIGENRWAHSYQTAYVTPGTTIRKGTPGERPQSRSDDFCEGKVGDLPAQLAPIVLRCGDSLILTRDLEPGRPGVVDEQGEVMAPARIGITLPEIFGDVRIGESIWLDDGRIGGKIVDVRPDEIEVEIVHARPGGERLTADKGINLPDSSLSLPSLTEDDIECLEFVATHADLVGYSFVRRASDIYELQDRLEDVGGLPLGIILKIETRTAFEHLPELLLAAMRSPSAGVMIARGDLAVECGYERLAEIQEEILWVCEAAHMPVIWATQVLETLAKGGLPSRAEITDAAMGERAECVMLNKGPYIVEAVRALDDILRRMEAHQEKKKSMLRNLKIADEFKSIARGN